MNGSDATVRPIRIEEIPLLEDFLYKAIHIPEDCTEEVPRSIIFDAPILHAS